MAKEDVIHTHTHTHTDNGILFIQKKEESLSTCDNMDGPLGFMLSEISQTEKDKYYMISLTCVI